MTFASKERKTWCCNIIVRIYVYICTRIYVHKYIICVECIHVCKLRVLMRVYVQTYVCKIYVCSFVIGGLFDRFAVYILCYAKWCGGCGH